MSYQSMFAGRSRGGAAPRRGRGESGPRFTFQKHREQLKPDLGKQPLGDLLHTFRNSDLEFQASILSDSPTITDCKYVASYNWIDSKSPSIMVPGKPPLWTPPKQPRRLKEDSGKYFRDPNAAKFPSFPIEPAVQSILQVNSEYPTSDLDIFACGSTLGNLLRFVRFNDKTYRFNVEVIGNTVFFVRKENDPRELIPNVRGFGHTFPEAYTTWEGDVKGSETHQRLVQYNFGGSKCLIRFECDGYIDNPSSARISTSAKPGASIDEYDLLDKFATASIGQNIPSSDGKLSVKPGGTEVSQDAIFDLKTRSGRYKRDIDMSDIYPLLWIKQIPNFIIAYHDGAGLFEDVRVQDVRKDIEAWEKVNSAAIKRLAILLRKIIDIAKDEEGLLEVYCSSADCLEIRRQHGKGSRALPASLQARWKRLSDAGSGSNSDEEFCEAHEKGGIDLKAEHDSLLDDDSDEEKDYTGCSDTCGYCGTCTY